MKKWEYDLINSFHKLEEMGKVGWRCIQVIIKPFVDTIYLMEREIEQPKKEEEERCVCIGGLICRFCMSKMREDQEEEVEIVSYGLVDDTKENSIGRTDGSTCSCHRLAPCPIHL